MTRDLIRVAKFHTMLGAEAVKLECWEPVELHATWASAKINNE
jgi:hypothetical protein